MCYIFDTKFSWNLMKKFLKFLRIILRNLSGSLDHDCNTVLTLCLQKVKDDNKVK